MILAPTLFNLLSFRNATSKCYWGGQPYFLPHCSTSVIFLPIQLSCLCHSEASRHCPPDLNVPSFASLDSLIRIIDIDCEQLWPQHWTPAPRSSPSNPKNDPFMPFQFFSVCFCSEQNVFNIKNSSPKASHRMVKRNALSLHCQENK